MALQRFTEANLKLRVMGTPCHVLFLVANLLASLCYIVIADMCMKVRYFDIFLKMHSFP